MTRSHRQLAAASAWPVRRRAIHYCAAVASGAIITLVKRTCDVIAQVLLPLLVDEEEAPAINWAVEWPAPRIAGSRLKLGSFIWWAGTKCDGLEEQYVHSYTVPFCCV